MLKLHTLCQYLERVLPSNGVVDYGPNGLQVEGKDSIKKMATAVTASLATIEAAVEMGVDALIVHHGLFWNKESMVITESKKKKLVLLLQHNISLFAYHLPLDMHPQVGNNWKAAQEMGWTNLQPFCMISGGPIGVKGELSSIARDDFKAELEKYYQHEAVCALGGKKHIKTVALVSGGAHRNIANAIQEGVDAYVTGSFDEPTWHQALEGEINFFALGHSATERVGPKALAQLIETELSVPCAFIDTKNPF